MTESPVIDPTEVTTPLRLLDVRDAVSFAAGHAPGAVRVPIEDWIATARSPGGTLENSNRWAEAISEMGIGPDGHAGIYDDGRMTEAARIWFILQYFGISAVILNGGWADVEASGLASAPADPALPVLRAGSGRVELLDRFALLTTLDERAVFDARTRDEYLGLDLKSNSRGGHLPDAVLLPHADLLDGTRLRSPADLGWRLRAAGFSPDRPLTTHCDGGGRAALAAAAALHAGYTAVSVYYLSFSDWAADENCPIVTPNP